MPPWKCSQCGNLHETTPNSFAFDEPIYWGDRRKWPAPRGCSFNKDYCVIDNDGHFIRAILEIPILGTSEVFTFGVWSTLSEANFKREKKLARDPDRVKEQPYFGWFSNRIWQYPDTLNLKCNLHSQPPGKRPKIELEPTDHPLAVEQRNGITEARFHELSEQCLHGWKHPDSAV